MSHTNTTEQTYRVTVVYASGRVWRVRGLSLYDAIESRKRRCSRKARSRDTAFRNEESTRMAATFAYAWRSGLLEFGSTVPDGAIKIGRLGSGVRKADIEALARHSRTVKGQLLVPGVPEALDDTEAVDALIRFESMVKERQVKRQAKSGGRG